jgi:hypothetical protein
MQADADRNKKGVVTMSTKLDTPFDTDNEEGSKFDLMPDGKYPAEIFAAEYGPTGTGRGMQIKFTWQIVGDGQYARRVIYQYVMLEHESEKAQTIGRGMFKDIIVCCGITGPVDDLETLYFKPCVISVRSEKDRTGEYPDKNKIVRVYPIGALATPEQVRKQQQADALREASTPKASFKASDDDDMSDSIPF